MYLHINFKELILAKTSGLTGLFSSMQVNSKVFINNLLGLPNSYKHLLNCRSLRKLYCSVESCVKGLKLYGLYVYVLKVHSCKLKKH